VSPGELSIYFAFDKSGFDSDSITEKYFDVSNKYLDQNSQARINITGYTDAVGSDEYNQALGYRRAQSLQNYFKSKGMQADKVIIESRGEKEPVGDNNSSAGRASNRRAVITIKN
jgi:OOP family OmpA-OmpF porin